MSWAIVTGARQGKGIAGPLGEGRRENVGGARPRRALEALRPSLAAHSRDYRWYTADLAEPDEGERVANQISRDISDIDVLVNNAGGGIGSRPLVRITDEDWRRLLRLNVLTPYVLTRVLATRMMERGYGRIINISSPAARYRVATEVTSAAYVAAKGAVLGLTRQTAKLLASSGIAVNAILPGDVLTEAGTELFESLSASDRRGILKRIPRGALTTPEEIGAVVLALCQRQAGAIIGVSLDVNGGAWIQ